MLYGRRKHDESGETAVIAEYQEGPDRRD